VPDSVVPLSRLNELTAVIRRDRFDAAPGDVTSARDLERWRAFRTAYHNAQDLGAAPFPLQLDFELTSQCNLRCAFCIHGYSKIEKRGLTPAQFRRAIEEGAAHGLCSVKLNYINEPLLTRDLPDYVRYAKAHGVLNVYFATNGTLLTERVREELIEARVSKIMVSLDATTPETFLKMRQSPQFERIVANVRALIARRDELGLSWPLVRVNFLKSPLNIHEAEDFVKEWTGVADMIGLQDQVGLPGIETDFLASGPYVDHSAFRCSFPFKMLVIDSAGHILPCCTFSGREMPLGHVDELTLEAAWNGDRMRALKESHRSGTWTSNPVCVRCVKGT